MRIVHNCISSKQSTKIYEGIGSVSSLQIGQYEASLIGKRNEVVLDAVSKSQVKTMTKAYECLGKTISVGGKRKFEALRSNVDSERVFI